MTSNTSNSLISLVTMVEQLVSDEIDEIKEITARTGPRTGALAIDKESVNKIIQLGKAYLASQNLGSQKKIIVIPSPITGKPTRIPVTFFFEPDPKNTWYAWYIPYKNAAGGQVFFNMAKFDPDGNWFRSVVFHELTHLFDKQRGSAEEDAVGSDYFQAPREKTAHLQQLVSEMTYLAKEVASSISSGKESQRLLGQTLVKKPLYLLRNTINRDPLLRDMFGEYLEDTQFLKKLMQAAYSITQNIIKPVLESQGQQPDK